MVTPAAMALMFRVMSAQCPTIRTGTITPPRETATPSQVQRAIEPEIIQAVHTIMELVTPSIPVHVVDSITTTAMDTRPMFQRGTCGKGDKVQARIGGIRKVALNFFLYHPTI